MGIGIFNKLKKAFKSIGQRIGGFAKKAVAALPKVADVGHKVIGAVSPILSTTFPGTAPILKEQYCFKWLFSHLLKSGKYHADYPEENNIVTCH